MANFTAGAVLTASALNSAFNTATINAQTTAYTFGTADAGELVTVNNNSGGTVTIPANSTWGAATGTIVSVLNAGTAGSWTIGTAAGVTLNANSASLAPLESGQLVKTATNTWYFTKGGLGKASVTATTGSPTVTTVSGKTCYQFTGSGTITIGGNGGTCDILVVGAGGAGGLGNGSAGGGGGAGGHLYIQNAYLPSGSNTITVGAGGSTASDYGNPSRCGSYFSPAGGIGGDAVLLSVGRNGASGGGGCVSSSGGSGFVDLGKNGGSSTSSSNGGGGGGASAAGSNGSGTTGGAGGDGLANSITGSSVTRAGGGGGAGTGSHGSGGAGGGGAGNAAGTANTGGGGGGVTTSAGSAGKAGGSGVVIVLVG